MAKKTVGSANVANPKISPKFNAADWRALDLSKPDSADWDRAVDIFLDRLEGRFLAPVNAIRNHPDSAIAEFSGFLVVAIDCLLIETLVQFRRGEDETSGEHKKAFAEFFRESKFFSPDFDTRPKAYTFYSHFRCGILHQAQTKKRSLVRFGMVSMVEPSVPGKIKDGLIIDRELFHQALTQEVQDYAARLRQPTTKEDFKRRSKFVEKMNFIVG